MTKTDSFLPSNLIVIHYKSSLHSKLIWHLFLSHFSLFFFLKILTMSISRPNCLFPILTVLLYLFVAITAYGVEGGEDHLYPPKGGYFPFDNLNDPHLREIAEFAISKYNKIHDQKLVLQKLVHGQFQIVEGTNYKLVISVIHSSKVFSGPINYEIIVFENLWRTIKELKSFVRDLSSKENKNSTSGILSNKFVKTVCAVMAVLTLKCYQEAEQFVTAMEAINPINLAAKTDAAKNKSANTYSNIKGNEIKDED
ncbi:hypothetical protein DVH24_019017 [Malus domestica]|uniref:Cystatin domain-containing protein n=1 Tax=Malus domestica TaxID=3750 RepID=A0A498HZQ0_MALDO|nr:hypothetical protein DVH24_019017 [Malus domestica]